MGTKFYSLQRTSHKILIKKKENQLYNIFGRGERKSETMMSSYTKNIWQEEKEKFCQEIVIIKK